MSDFVHFIDRVSTLPNRKKITHADSSVEYATIEYADEPLEIGTPLNKANLSKLEWAIGYSKADGIWNPTTSTLEYNFDDLNVDSFIDDEILLLKGGNGTAPATNIEVIKATSNLLSSSSNYYSPRIAKLTSGNVAIVSYGRNYASIYSPDGTLITGAVSFTSSNFNNIQALDNNKFAIFGCNSTEGGYDNFTSYFAIFNSDGTAVINTSAGMMRGGGNLLKLSNGNILTVCSYWRNSSGSGAVAFNIYNQSGEQLYSGSNNNDVMWQNFNLIELNNGNIMIIAGNSYNSGYYMIIDNQCNVISSPSSATISSPKGVLLGNGNVFIIGVGNFVILSPTGSIIKSSTSIAGYDCILLSNGNVMTFGDNVFAIVSPDGTIIKGSTSIGTNFAGAKLVQMSNGNIIAVGHGGSAGSSTKPSYIAIIDINGNVAKTNISIGNSFVEPNLAELDNENYFIVGYNSYSSNNSYYCIVKPYADNGNASINGVPLDTMLQKDHYYEAIFNSTQNKFIAEEVRV